MTHTATTGNPRRRRLPALREVRPRYPVWSIKPVSLLLLLAIALTAVLVLWLGRRPVIQELEITLGIVAAVLFVFLAVGLYRGVRLKEQEPPGLQIPTIRDNGGFEVVPDLPDVGGCIDIGDEGCLGALVGLLLSVLVAILLLVFLVFFMQLAVALLAVLAAGVYWVFHLALRQVFAHSQDCHGRLTRSLGFAAWYTILYTGWLFGVLLAATFLIGDA